MNIDSKTMEPDFYYRNKPSVVLLIPHSNRAVKWMADNLKLQTWQYPEMPVIESDSFTDIGNAIVRDGLTIERQEH